MGVAAIRGDSAAEPSGERQVQSPTKTVTPGRLCPHSSNSKPHRGGGDLTATVQPSHSANKQVNDNDNRPQREGISNPQLQYHLKCSVFIKHYSNYAKKLESTNQTEKAGNRTSL